MIYLWRLLEFMLFPARFLANQATYNVHGPLVSMELQHALTLGGRPNSRVVIVVVLLKIQIRRIQIFVFWRSKNPTGSCGWGCIG